MKIIHTDESPPTDSNELLWAYNGLDCMLTAEILDALLPQLDEHTSATYSFSRSLQGPALEMRMRGVRIDQARKSEVIDEYFESLEILEEHLNRLVGEACDFWQFNWRSSKDLRELFYERLEIPVIRKQGKPTVERSALEKMEVYIVAKPIVRHLEAMQDVKMKIQFLRTAIDPDGRIRTSYNIGGTSTGRFSSSYSEFGTGGNLQNVEESLRSVFIADPGMKMGYFDGEQIQSRIVGALQWNICEDGKYLDACESGDLHTNVSKLVWPRLNWTGNPNLDKELAEQPYYRHYSRRFMSKKAGHGTNFDGSAAEIARQTRVDPVAIKDFQIAYTTAFPSRLTWRDHVAGFLREYGYWIALDGRKRHFLGRRGDDKTVKEALAYDAQSTEAWIVNNGMLNIWRARDATLYMHDHDALTVQYPEEREDEIIPIILKQLRVPIQLRDGRVLEIPYGCKTGWNKAEWTKDNPDGLKAWKGGDSRKRSPKMSILDRPIRRMDRKS